MAAEKKVIVMKDSAMTYPELYLDVYIAGDCHEQAAFAEMFVHSKCSKSESPETADLVVFTGGPDVNPAYYGEKKHPSTFCNDARDTDDIKLYGLCLSEGIPMFGVCRGAQFLHVMNGGKLFQHVNQHGSAHGMWCVHEKKFIRDVSSVHHQAIRMQAHDARFSLLGTSHESTIRWINDTEKEDGKKTDIEAFFYRDTCCLGVQGHPEYRHYDEYRHWCLERIHELVCDNLDLVPVPVPQAGKCLRMKDDLIKLRDGDFALTKEKVMN